MNVTQIGGLVDEDGCEVAYNIKEAGTDGPYFEIHCCNEDDASDCDIFEAADEETDRRILLAHRELSYESEFKCK